VHSSAYTIGISIELATTSLQIIVRQIESALRLGRYVGWKERHGFFAEVQLAKTPIDNLRSAGKQTEAIQLYEIFLAGSFVKADEVDDSCGDMADWIRLLMTDIVETRQESCEAPTRIAAKIIEWCDKDRCGFTDHFDQVLFAIGKPETIMAHRALLEERSLRKLSALKNQGVVEAQKFLSDTTIKDFDWLKAIYLHQKDVEAYLRISEAFGLMPDDFEKVALILQERGECREALNWAERGLALKSEDGDRYRYVSGDGLATLRRSLLMKLGRQPEAFSSAWAEFEAHPSVRTYREVAEYVAPSQSKACYEKVRRHILSAETRIDNIFDFLTKYNEHELLQDFIERTDEERLEKVAYTTLKETAKALEGTAPLAAAKLYKAEAIQILSRAKAKAYHYALENLAKVKELYESNGCGSNWNALAVELQAQHKRKSSFIGEFNAIVAGTARPKKMNFLERIGMDLPSGDE
jgi:hypothetical protein